MQRFFLAFSIGYVIRLHRFTVFGVNAGEESTESQGVARMGFVITRPFEADPILRVPALEFLLAQAEHGSSLCKLYAGLLAAEIIKKGPPRLTSRYARRFAQLGVAIAPSRGGRWT